MKNHNRCLFLFSLFGFWGISLLFFSCSQPLNIDDSSKSKPKNPDTYTLQSMKSIHQLFWEENRNYPHTYRSTAEIERAEFDRTVNNLLIKNLKKDLFGFYPNWMGSAYQGLNWDLLTIVAYFGIEIDSTGNISATGGWPNSSAAVGLINTAHQHYTKVLLTVIAFSGTIQNGVLQNSTNQERLINTIINQIKLGNADGVNIDFESMSSANKDYFTQFINNLSLRLKHEVPGALVTLDLPAVDWSSVFDINALSLATDIFFLMGYDYHWAGGNPGPVSPLLGESYNLTRSTESYLAKIAEPAKLVVGVPYYGLDWPSASQNKGAVKTANAKAVLYKNTVGKSFTWDSPTYTPWYSYLTDSQWHQVWFENSDSMEAKIKMMFQKNSAGMGIWALGYEGSPSNLWPIINSYFTGTPDITGSRDQPYIIDVFPYTKTSTTIGKQRFFSSYPPFTADESGPEEYYQINIAQKGLLACTVIDDSNVDVDIHLLQTLTTSSNCLIRSDQHFEYVVNPGIYYLVCDTYQSAAKAGVYRIEVTFQSYQPGSLSNPLFINCDRLPVNYTDTRNTQQSASDLIDTYYGFSANEGGPEYIYQLILTEKAQVQAALSGMASGVDIDVHLVKAGNSGDFELSGRQALNIITRNDIAFAVTCDPGTYYITADTYINSAGVTKSGSYILTVNITGMPGTVTNPFKINAASLPFTYTHSEDTSKSASDLIDYYNGFSADESGPEYFYSFTINRNVRLSASLTGMTGVTDIDVHLVKAQADGQISIVNKIAMDVITRNHNAISADISAGTYYIVADTYKAFSGEYTMTVYIQAVP